MNEQNLALRVRTSLNLSPTEAGKLLFDYRTGNSSQSYKTWSRWENGTRNIPLSTVKYFQLLLKLIDIYSVEMVIKLIDSEDLDE